MNGWSKKAVLLALFRPDIFFLRFSGPLARSYSNVPLPSAPRESAFFSKRFSALDLGCRAYNNPVGEIWERQPTTESQGVSMTSFVLNGKAVQTDADPATPLLWVLRESMGLTGTKYGCGMAQCGACTVHLEGQAIRSCVAPLSRAEGKHVTTIEGLSPDLSHPLQRAWIEIDVPQCGYCQSGQIMSAAVLLKENPKPTDKDIDEAMSGNICRCGTYPRIRRAIHRAAEMAAQGGAK
jgi:isoquinoline 1-oxidoreductase subunit alpha